MESMLKNSKQTKKIEKKTPHVIMHLPEKKMSIFAIVCSVTPQLHSTKFFATRELARAHLKKMVDERRYNFGVHMHDDTTDKFSYTLGWEESYVSFTIVEFPVES